MSCSLNSLKGVAYTPIMAKQMEKNMDNEMEAGVMG